MTDTEFFDASYVTPSSTKSEHTEKSKIKEFLKNPINEKEMISYGSSKPKRIVIRGKISGR